MRAFARRGGAHGTCGSDNPESVLGDERFLTSAG